MLSCSGHLEFQGTILIPFAEERPSGLFPAERHTTPVESGLYTCWSTVVPGGCGLSPIRFGFRSIRSADGWSRRASILQYTPLIHLFRHGGVPIHRPFIVSFALHSSQNHDSRFANPGRVNASSRRGGYNFPPPLSEDMLRDRATLAHFVPRNSLATSDAACSRWAPRSREFVCQHDEVGGFNTIPQRTTKVRGTIHQSPKPFNSIYANPPLLLLPGSSLPRFDGWTMNNRIECRLSTSRSQFPDTGSITFVDYGSNTSRGLSPTPYPRAHVELFKRFDHEVYEYNGDSAIRKNLDC